METLTRNGLIPSIILRFTALKVKCFSENTARYVDVDFTKEKNNKKKKEKKMEECKRGI